MTAVPARALWEREAKLSDAVVLFERWNEGFLGSLLELCCLMDECKVCSRAEHECAPLCGVGRATAADANVSLCLCNCS